MASSNSSYLEVASGHSNSLISYVLDVKPYHTKLSEIVEEYVFGDDIDVKITEDESLLAFLGADILPTAGSAVLGVRKRRSNSWHRDVASDGSRNVWEVPLTSVHKFMSHASQEKFIADGVQDLGTIPGLATGVFNPRRWDGPGITNVKLDGTHQQEAVDYFLSHGAYSFEIRPGQRWKELNLKNVLAFAENPGEAYYQEVIRSYGTVKDITGGNNEEWTLTCIAIGPAQVEVVGSVSGPIGVATINVPFVHPLIQFTYGDGPGELDETADVGNEFILTSFRKITVAVDAPIEQWSLIKTNPISLGAAAVFVSPSRPLRTDSPSMEIHTRSLDIQKDPQSWTLTFAGDGTYSLTLAGPDGYTVSGIDLRDGCSYKNADIHFSLLPTTTGFFAGDSFSWTVGARVENYLVYGSVSGWQPNAKIGEWYWNGKIGFKIPKLDYWAKAYNSTIISSATGTADSWATVVSNNQVLRSVSYDETTQTFFTAGDRSIVGASTDGSVWTSDIDTVITPTPLTLLVIVGAGGVIATSEDGVTWLQQDTGTTSNLNGYAVIPNLLSPNPAASGIPGSLTAVIAVGDNGTVLSSINGIGWTSQSSGVTANLKSIAWSDDGIFAIGEGGLILKSLDRVTWTPCVTPVTVDLHGIAYNPTDNSFTVVGDNGVILRSVNGGTTWLNLGAFVDGTLTSVAYGGGRYVAVGPDGWVAGSADGVVWTRQAGPALNSITYGNGRFVAVGGKDTELEQFVELKPVHSIAEPSVYTITFVNQTNATVQNNLYGFRRGLVVGETWEDEFCSFRLDPLPSGFSYVRGDVVKVFLAPSYTYSAEGWYDENIYAISGYDTGTVDFTVPWLYHEEYYPLYHNHGSVIFRQITPGSNVVIDKALRDVMRFKIAGSSEVYPYLAAEDDWIPLEFRYFDRVVDGVATSNAEFSDLTTQIEAYLCSDPSVKVLTIEQPRYETTNRNASALLAIDADFFATYLPFNVKYSMRFQPDDSYGQTIRVKITENLRTYARVNLIFDEIHYISISDADPRALEIINEIELVDLMGVQFVEGGALPLPNGYDVYPYDVFPYSDMIRNGVLPGMVETQPGVYDWTGLDTDWLIPKQVADTAGIYVEESNPETAGTSFVEGLLIFESAGGSVQRLSVPYDLTSAGLLIEQAAPKYVVTCSAAIPSPTVRVESVANPGVLGSPIIDRHVFAQIPSATSDHAFSFSLPAGFTVPFTLTVT